MFWEFIGSNLCSSLLALGVYIVANIEPDKAPPLSKLSPARFLLLFLCILVLGVLMLLSDLPPPKLLLLACLLSACGFLKASSYLSMPVTRLYLSKPFYFASISSIRCWTSLKSCSTFENSGALLRFYIVKGKFYWILASSIERIARAKSYS